MTDNNTPDMVAVARQEVDQWRSAVAVAEEQLTAHEQVLPKHPGELDDVGSNVEAARARVGAARRALDAAGVRLLEAWESRLRAEAEQEDAAATAAQAKEDAHMAKVDALLAKLAELDGITFGPATTWTDFGPHTPTGGLSAELQEEVEVHRVRAAVLRTMARTHRLPLFRTEAGLLILPGRGDLLLPEHRPVSCGEFYAELNPPVPPTEADLARTADYVRQEAEHEVSMRRWGSIAASMNGDYVPVRPEPQVEPQVDGLFTEADFEEITN